MSMSTVVLTHRAAALVGEIAMATREGWSLHRIHELEDARATALEELHGHAIAEDVVRGIEGDDDVTLGRLLSFALLLDVDAPRAAIAIRVVRDRLHEHAVAVHLAGRNTQRSGREGVPHNMNYSSCSAGVDQWR